MAMSQNFSITVSNVTLRAVCPNPNAVFQYSTMFDQTEGLNIRSKSDGSIHVGDEADRAQLSIELLIEILGWHSATIENEKGVAQLGPLGMRTLLLPPEAQSLLNNRLSIMKGSRETKIPIDSIIRSVRPEDIFSVILSKFNVRRIPTTGGLKMDAAICPWWNPRF